MTYRSSNSSRSRCRCYRVQCKAIASLPKRPVHKGLEHGPITAVSLQCQDQ